MLNRLSIVGNKIVNKPSNFLLKDDFNTDVSAGALNNTLATDKKNIRLVSDSENKLSTQSSKLVFNGGKTGPVIGNPGLVYSLPFNRFEGLTLEGSVLIGGSTQGSFGFHNTNIPSFGLKSGIRFLNAKFYDAISSTDLVTRSWGNAYKILRMIIHSAGYDIYTSEDGGLSFFHEYQNTVDVTNPLYLHVASYNISGKFDWINITKKPRSPFYGSISDNFNRPDTVATAGTLGMVGSLGTTPEGMPWVLSGTNIPFIKDGYLVVNSSIIAAGYAFLNFPNNVMPHTMKSTIIWNNIGGSNTDGDVVLIAGDEPLSSMVHAVFNRQGHVGITVWDSLDGGNHINIGSVSYPICDFDTLYNIGMKVSGNTVIIETPDGLETSFTHTSIGNHWGRKLCYELTSPSSTIGKPKIKNATVLW